MADQPDVPAAMAQGIPETTDAAEVVLANRAVPASQILGLADDEVLQVLEETLTVSTRRKPTGTLRVSTSTEVIQETAEAKLDRYRVEVTRVPVGRIVDEAPVARAEGDTTIIPVVEERLVVVKQLFLVEEVHVRHVVEREVVREPVTVRRQRAVVERMEPRVGLDEAAPSTTNAAASSANGRRPWSHE